MTRMFWILAIINVTAFSFGWYARGRVVAATLHDTTKVWEQLRGGRAFTIQILASATGVHRWRVRLVLINLERVGEARRSWIRGGLGPDQLLWRATTPGPGGQP